MLIKNHVIISTYNTKMVHCMFFILVFEVIFLWCDLKLWGLKDRVWSSIFFIGFSFQIGETAPSLLVEEAELLRNYRGECKNINFWNWGTLGNRITKGVEIATPTKFCGLLNIKMFGLQTEIVQSGLSFNHNPSLGSNTKLHKNKVGLLLAPIVAI